MCSVSDLSHITVLFTPPNAASSARGATSYHPATIHSINFQKVSSISICCCAHQVGDRIISTNGMMPTGGLAEHAAVQVKWSGKAPSNVSPTEAAVLPNSPVAAMHAVQAARVKEGDRVLVLGGSGGVGSSLLQLVKDAKVRAGCGGEFREKQGPAREGRGVTQSFFLFLFHTVGDDCGLQPRRFVKDAR